MKVKRIICPACESEKNVVSDGGNLHEYSEEVVSEFCDRKECQEAYNSPEEKLLRAIFGERQRR